DGTGELLREIRLVSKRLTKKRGGWRNLVQDANVDVTITSRAASSNTAEQVDRGDARFIPVVVSDDPFGQRTVHPTRLARLCRAPKGLRLSAGAATRRRRL